MDYTGMSNLSKVWVYQSDREIKLRESHSIQRQLIDFCDNWKTHGQQLHSSFKIDNWFVCILVDESHTQISGCSIDESIHLIKDIGKKYNINFFNRTHIAFIDNGITQVLPLSKFKAIMHDKIIIYDNTISTKQELETSWKIAVSESWLQSKMF
tara:strand:- start:745 stop:1206 length:462 start_codon:yes stop_codon:yes gene_type:complete